MYYDLKTLTPEKFVKKYKFRNDNLEKAMSKGYEIYIHGKYIAVNQEYFKENLDHFPDIRYKIGS